MCIHGSCGFRRQKMRGDDRGGSGRGKQKVVGDEERRTEGAMSRYRVRPASIGDDRRNSNVLSSFARFLDEKIEVELKGRAYFVVGEL